MIKPISAFSAFTVSNLVAARSYYTEYLGFEVAFCNEWYLHLASNAGVQIGFLLPDQPSQPAFLQRLHPGDGAIFSLEVEDADSAYQLAQEHSLDIVLPLCSEDWGQRHFCLRDPNGLYLDILHSIPPTEEFLAAYQPGYS